MSSLDFTSGQKDFTVQVLVALAAAALILLFTQEGILKLGILERLELASIDYRFQVRGPLPVISDSSEVILVEISEDSFRSLPEKFPWPRSYYARAVRNLTAAGAKVVGIDLILSGVDSYSPQNDEQLRAAIRETQVVVLAGKREQDQEYLRTTSAHEVYGNIFYADDSSMGLVNIRPDADGIYRLYNVRYDVDVPGEHETAIPTFAFAVLNKYFDLPASTTPRSQNGSFVYREIVIPRYDAGSLLINYYGPNRTFRHIQFHDVLDDEDFTTLDEKQSGQEINTFSDPEYGYLVDGTFKDKIVLIGVTVPEYKDLFPVSIARGRQRGDNLMYGVEIHANVIESVLRGEFLTKQSPVSQLLVTVALVLITFLVTSGLKALRARSQFLIELYGFLFVIVLFVAVSWSALVLFRSFHYILIVSSSFLAIAGGYAASTVYHLITERKQRLLIKSMFSTYVNPTLVEELVANPEKLVLGGKREELTVLFSDIEGFTTIAQNMPPEQLVKLLNGYLSVMSDIIFQHNGTLDKYEGDAIMAFWGAPIAQTDHALRACLSALEMQKALLEINRSWREAGNPEIQVRIGINTGQMVVGNMGATSKFNYTVMGDSVNLASRLEGANKEYRTGIMVSEQTYELVRHAVLGRQLDRIAVKGRSEPVTTYELIAPLNEEIAPDTQKFLALYSEALQLYYRRNWRKSKTLFTHALQLRPEDVPTRLHLKQISTYELTPPPRDWNGVFVLTTK